MANRNHWDSKTTTKTAGDAAEDTALAYLCSLGLTVLERNFRTRGGEIDLIMSDKGYIVFVEVRQRKHSAFGGAIASIDRRKQSKLITAAQAYLQQHTPHSAARFDVIALQGDNQPEWIKNAFSIDPS